MKELRVERKEYEKNLRLGNVAKIQSTVQKYGIDFTLEDDATGLMAALYHGQTDIALSLLAQGASTTLQDKSNRLALDYLLSGYLKNKKSKQKQSQLADERTLTQCWEKASPQALVYEFKKRQFRTSSHSMLFFLILLMRNTTTERIAHKKEGDKTMTEEFPLFTMDDMENLANLLPDALLPPYRKKRTYINSVMALHELYKDSPYCKETFIRVQRGMYVLNPDIIF
jgi:hypothetical protein